MEQNSDSQESWVVENCEVEDKSHRFLLCSVCWQLMLKPKVLTCGHTFCDSCCTRLINGSILSRHCPSCRHKIVASNFPVNVSVKSHVSTLHVKCKEEGCGWKGTVQGVNAHLKQCERRRIPCEFPGCEYICQRRQLAGHMDLCPFKLVKCKECLKELPEAEVEEHIRTSCSRRDVFCPLYDTLGNRHKVKKSDATLHMARCGFGIVKCSVEGCMFVGQKRELEEHNSKASAHHCVLLRQAQRELVSMIMTRKTSEFRSSVKETTVAVWAFSWTIEDSLANVKQALSLKVPLNSHDFRESGATWRLLWYPELNTSSGGKIYLQLRSSLSPMKVKVKFMTSTHTLKTKPHELKEGELYGLRIPKIQITEHSDVKFGVFVNILEYRKV